MILLGIDITLTGMAISFFEENGDLTDTQYFKFPHNTSLPIALQIDDVAKNYVEVIEALDKDLAIKNIVIDLPSDRLSSSRTIPEYKNALFAEAFHYYLKNNEMLLQKIVTIELPIANHFSFLVGGEEITIGDLGNKLNFTVSDLKTLKHYYVAAMFDRIMEMGVLYGKQKAKILSITDSILAVLAYQFSEQKWWVIPEFNFDAYKSLYEEQSKKYFSV